jgi:hypothetical protein
MARLLDTRPTPDGEHVDRWYFEDGKVWRVRSQNDRRAILEKNKALRNADRRKEDGLRWALSIPTDDYDVLVKLNPDLGSVDRQIKNQAWRKFLASPESIPYRVYEPKGRGRSA